MLQKFHLFIPFKYFYNIFRFFKNVNVSAEKNNLNFKKKVMPRQTDNKILIINNNSNRSTQTYLFFAMNKIDTWPL